MKRLITLFSICFLFLPASALSVPADLSTGGVEVTAPNEIVVHNARVGDNFYSVTFRWNPRFNIWYPTEYGPEESSFTTREYYPLEQGRTWTYQRSDASSLILAIDGTEEICGVECVRQSTSDGGAVYWISDETGVYMTRFLNPDGTHTTWCPPMKIAPPQVYLGTQELNPFFDAFFGHISGPQYGSQDGWSSFIVKGVEDVTVPAGTFTDCLRVTFVYTFTDTWTGIDGYRIEEAWYAENVGIVRRTSTNTGFLGGSILGEETETYLLTDFTIPV